MSVPRTSKIWTTDRPILQKIFDESSTKVEVLRKLGFDEYNGNHRTLVQRMRDDIDLTKFNENYDKWKKEQYSKQTIPTEMCLVPNSKYNRRGLKKRLIKEKLMDYKCYKCENIGEWEGQKLSLQIDHINGVNNDNRIENLRFACPNCHSQTETFSGKRCKRIYYCQGCSSEIFKGSKLCIKCCGLTKRRTNITKLELEELIKDNSYQRIGNMLGISRTSVIRTAIRFGIKLEDRTSYRVKRAKGHDPSAFSLEN